MLCPRCSCENPDQARFCLECGTKLELTCPSCGTPLPPQAKFCMNCGQAVGSRETTPPPPSAEPTPAAESVLTEGERKQATVLFSDLSGYTALNEELDPEEVQDLMSRLKRAAVQLIEQHGGMVNQFVGDEILALFGIPTASEDDAPRAVRAALALHAMVPSFLAEHAKGSGRTLRFHSGIASGLVVVSRQDARDGTFSITGDTVNTASRLADLAEVDEVLVSPEAYRLVAYFFACEAMSRVLLRGKAEPLTPYRVRG